MTVAVTDAVAEVPAPEIETKPDEERFVPCSKPGCQGRVDLNRIPAKVRHLDHSTLLCKKCAREKSAAKANRTQGPKHEPAPPRHPCTQARQPPAVEHQTPDVLVPLSEVRKVLVFLDFLPKIRVDTIVKVLETRAAPSSDK